jgi:hypothetical protein
MVMLCIATASAQDRISSPYSRFGVGELLGNTHANNMAMGGITQGVYNPLYVNYANPASYTAFDSLSFVFDVGLHARLTNLSTVSASQSANYASLGNLLFGFPVTRWWKASFGLLPYSATGYKMTDHHADSIWNNYNNVYEGKGGINQFYVGSSFDLSRHLSLGINAAYLFGTMDHSSSTEFPDSLYRFNSVTKYSTRAHDFMITYGIMYHKEFSDKFHFTAGGSFIAKTALATTADRVTYTYTSSGSGVDSPRDTIDFAESAKENITLPTGFGAGFTIGKGNKWLLGSDFKYTQWEDFKFSATSEPLVNNMQIALGGFYNPSTSTVSNYLSKITYRAGLRYSNGLLELRGQRIDEFGISFGVGLPLSRTSSTINIAVEAGSRGTKEQNLINENYVKFTLGLSIFERWFIIKKYE